MDSVNPAQLTAFEAAEAIREGSLRSEELVRACLERIDQMIGQLPHAELVIGVTGDHSTDSNFGRHCGDPVPGLICAPNGRRDLTGVFGESHCMTGGLGRLSATSFLYSMLDAMEAIGNFRPDDSDFILPN
jgi:2,3-bisphosphoglycerate-independent phosphoglycerate mutase